MSDDEVRDIEPYHIETFNDLTAETSFEHVQYKANASDPLCEGFSIRKPIGVFISELLAHMSESDTGQEKEERLEALIWVLPHMKFAAGPDGDTIVYFPCIDIPEDCPLRTVVGPALVDPVDTRGLSEPELRRLQLREVRTALVLEADETHQAVLKRISELLRGTLPKMPKRYGG